jgi:hypothetical protein
MRAFSESILFRQVFFFSTWTYAHARSLHHSQNIQSAEFIEIVGDEAEEQKFIVAFSKASRIIRVANSSFKQTRQT